VVAGVSLLSGPQARPHIKRKGEISMKRFWLGIAVLCLLFAGTYAFAFTEDFDGPGDVLGSPDPDWTTMTGWIWSATDWQIVTTPAGDQGYRCLNSDQATNMRGATMITGLSEQNLTMELDIYNLHQEIGLFVRAVDYGGNTLDTIGFFVHEWGFEGLGAGFFNWFNLTGQPEGWVPKGYQNWVGSFPHGENLVHVKLDVVGQTFRGQAWAYDSNGFLTGTLDTTYTYISPEVNRSGMVGLGAYSNMHIIDNVSVGVIPEPGSLAALAMGLGLAVPALRRRRR